MPFLSPLVSKLRHFFQMFNRLVSWWFPTRSRCYLRHFGKGSQQPPPPPQPHPNSPPPLRNPDLRLDVSTHLLQMGVAAEVRTRLLDHPNGADAPEEGSNRSHLAEHKSVWVKNRYPTWNPGKGKKDNLWSNSWWFNFDPWSNEQLLAFPFAKRKTNERLHARALYPFQLVQVFAFIAHPSLVGSAMQFWELAVGPEMTPTWGQDEKYVWVEIRKPKAQDSDG